MERIMTAHTRLEVTPELKGYLDEYIIFYNQIQRRIFQDIKHGIVKLEYGSLSKYITHICLEYGVLKRTANSIYRDMQGRIRAYQELKNTEIRFLETKIDALEKKIHKLERSMLKQKALAIKNQLSDIRGYANIRGSLYWKRNKLNRLRQRLDKLIRDKDFGIISLCFGSKDQFGKQYRLNENGYRSHEAWLHDFRRKRDCGIYFLGSGEESFGNQILQLRYDDTAGCFTMYLLKDKPYRRSNKLCDKQTILPGVKFKYVQGWLVSAIQAGQPVTYRICRRGRKWYLMASFKVDVPVRSVTSHGVMAADYNDGFMEVSETDDSGNLVGLQHVQLEHHGTGDKAGSEIKERIAGLVKEAGSKGKSIVIEDLDFKKKKAKQLKNGNKDYNRMLHLFDYHRYKAALQDACILAGVELVLVNPAYTSKIGKQKYCFQKKLNTHQAASYVIARRGQGFSDKFVTA